MNEKEPFKREYGYLYIVTPEDKAKYGPRVVSDDLWLPGTNTWHPNGPAGVFAAGCIYRRKISPGTGFEIVPLDGVPEEKGCEMLVKNSADFNDWRKLYGDNRTVRQWISIIPEILAIRRPLTKPVESGWVTFSKDSLPKPCTPFYATDGVKLMTYPCGLGDPEIIIRFWTHWMPWELPALPQPPRPAAEVGFDSWLHGASIPTCGLKSARDGWEAAIAWAKSNKGEL